MLTQKRHILILAAVLAALAMTGGVSAAELAAHQSPSQPAIVLNHANPAPALDTASAGELT